MAHILMICHDQNLDRRVVAQANSLIKIGHKVTLLALSFTADGEKSTTPEGIHLVRIGLNQVVPNNKIYVAYIFRQNQLNNLLNKLCNTFSFGGLLWRFTFNICSRTNWGIYRTALLIYYRNWQMADPLPFTSAFKEAGLDFFANIVQVHDLPGLEAGVYLAKKWQVPLVYDAHELYPEQRSFSLVQRKVCSEAESQLIQCAQSVFAVNDSISQEMAKRYGIKRPLTLLNAIDPPEDFDPDKKYDLLREKLGIRQDYRILLFQGGFAPHRNLEELIKAMRFVKAEDIVLVVMGFGSFGDKLKAIANRYGLIDKRVYFLPAVPQSELLQHSASADMGIIPYPHVDLNSYYCTPNKLFEFIQAGLPILANDSPELRNFVEKQNFGLIRPLHTIKQISAAIDQAFLNNDFMVWKQNLVTKRTDFAWQKQHIVYLNTIQLLLNNENQNILKSIDETIIKDY
jgi:glycosyltransferase involved in cell wall biosynthesis